MPMLSCFLFLFDENMVEYWYPRKTIQGQKYLTLADIATLRIFVFQHEPNLPQNSYSQTCNYPMQKGYSSTDK